MTINLNSQDDHAPVITPGQGFSVPENAANGTALGTVVATDVDMAGRLQNWTITGGNTDGIFAIDPDTGEITVSDNANLNFETTSSYTLTVTVSDGVNTSAPQTVTVNVTSVNEASTATERDPSLDSFPSENTSDRTNPPSNGTADSILSTNPT